MVNKTGSVTAESSMSALTMGAIDIGRNAKFIESFFSGLDSRVG